MRLAIELFFKAGLALEGKQYRRTHDLGDLRTAFEESGAQVRLPIPEDLERFIPKEFPSISTQRELFEPPPLQPVVQSSAWHFERLRYATDRQGKPFPDLDLPDIAHFKEELEQLQAAALKIMIRVWRTDDEE